MNKPFLFQNTNTSIMKPVIHNQYIIHNRYKCKIWKKNPQSSKEFRDFCRNQLNLNNQKWLCNKKKKEAKKAERKEIIKELKMMAKERKQGNSEVCWDGLSMAITASRNIPGLYTPSSGGKTKSATLQPPCNDGKKKYYTFEGSN